MIEIRIPGGEPLRLEHLVLDFNGTLACDGSLIDGVMQALERLREHLTIHVVTADTFGKAHEAFSGTHVQVSVLPPQDQAEQKKTYVRNLGADATVAVGNGRNDADMLQAAALGIAVIQEEGASMTTLTAADVVCPTISSALNLLTNPKRLIATLRR